MLRLCWKKGSADVWATTCRNRRLALWEETGKPKLGVHTSGRTAMKRVDDAFVRSPRCVRDPVGPR